jgi:hypothetical protein
MTPAYPQWPGIPVPFGSRRGLPPTPAGVEIPDHQTQLEELLNHVRRCERWANLDDRIDLGWKGEP